MVSSGEDCENQLSLYTEVYRRIYLSLYRNITEQENTVSIVLQIFIAFSVFCILIDGSMSDDTRPFSFLKRRIASGIALICISFDLATNPLLPTV